MTEKTITLYEECFEKAWRAAQEEGRDSVSFSEADAIVIEKSKELSQDDQGRYLMVAKRNTRKDKGKKRPKTEPMLEKYGEKEDPEGL